MKVLHINISDVGGAGKAAIRLHQGLLSEGVDSHFLCLRNSTDNINNVHAYKEGIPFAQNVSERIRLSLNKFRPIYWKRNRVRSAVKPYNLPIAVYDLASHPLVQQADVINLHWVSVFLDWPSFFKRVNAPIVWTLHDMHPFVGGLHYPNLPGFTLKGFDDIERSVCAIKESALNGKKLSIVSPSKWLMSESIRSQLFGNFDHYHIPNAINTRVFRPQGREQARDHFGISTNKKLLLFVANSLKKERKGFKFLLEAMRLLSEIEFEVLVVGRTDEEIVIGNRRIHSTGFIHSEADMALAYNAVDIFAVPSIQDNLPSTVSECLACGTPVVAFRTGGIPDMIDHGVNGLLCESTTAEDLAESLLKALNEDFDSALIREKAERQFSTGKMTRDYSQVYQNALASQGVNVTTHES